MNKTLGRYLKKCIVEIEFENWNFTEGTNITLFNLGFNCLFQLGPRAHLATSTVWV